MVLKSSREDNNCPLKLKAADKPFDVALTILKPCSIALDEATNVW
jgi:hypothetical protein